ncbi:hypothetical protein EJB05_07631, partial [Eragrostis curvula]
MTSPGTSRQKFLANHTFPAMSYCDKDGALSDESELLRSPDCPLLDIIFPMAFFGVAAPFTLPLVPLLAPWFFSASVPAVSSFVVLDKLRSSTAMTPSHSSSVFVVAPELRGASRLRRGAAAATRALDRAAKWLHVPSVPDLFRPFAGWFVYGLGGGGGDAALAAEALFASVVNMARGRAAVVAAEVAACDPLRRRIPHWRRLSCAEDLWCMKRLGGGNHADGWDWSRSAPGNAIFVDPREV